MRVLTLVEIAAEIEQSLKFLETDTRDLPERHRSLWAVCDHSWALLSPAEQTVYRRLAIFRGGFTREAAEQVAGATLGHGWRPWRTRVCCTAPRPGAMSCTSCCASMPRPG